MADAQVKQTRTYFCRPCKERHAAPTNAKCPRKRNNAAKPTGNDSSDEGSPASGHRSSPSKANRASKRGRQGSSSPEAQATERRTTKARRKRKDYQASMPHEEHSEVENSLDLILQRLETLSNESRSARDQMAREAKADREDIRRSIAAVQKMSERSSSVGESSEAETQAPQPEASAAATGTVETPESLGRSPNPMKQLRQDRNSAAIANQVLNVTAATKDDQGSKKLKSGFLLTVNDNVHVQAQWPQLNVYRSAGNLATYGSLSINEFCSGFITYVKDNLSGPNPDINVALDDLVYLGELLDEIPSFTWEAVRTAHGEILRLIEQARLKWVDKQARAKFLTIALRRAHMQILAKQAQNSVSEAKRPAIEKKPCPQYQLSECPEKGTHSEEKITWLHCCATCYKVKKQRYAHPKTECNRQKAIQDKAAVPKN